MPPKATEKSSKAGKGSQKGEVTQATRMDFGLPPAVTTSLQSISSRATQDLWLQTNFNQEDATAEQQAQRRANAISKLSKRLSGNARAKDELKTSLQQWLSTIGLHLLGLMGRVRAIGDKIDEDTSGAVQEMQAVLVEQQSSASSDRVALAQGSLGRVWSLSQEAEVQAIASALRAFSSGALAGPPDLTSAAWRLGAGSVPARTPPPLPAHGAAGHMVGAGDMGSEASFGLPGRSHVVGMDYGLGDTPVSVQLGAGTEQASASGQPSVSSGGRWRKRESTGRTPESLSRPPVTEITDNDTELIPDLSHIGPVAPAALLRFAVESGADPVGDLTACPRQDAALPVTMDAQAEPLVRQRVEQTWQALKDGVSDESDVDLPTLHRLLAEALQQLRGCAGALPAAPQGLVVAAHISVGGLLDPFAYAPATAQEWLFPGLLTEAGLPCKGFIASEASAHHHVQTILRQPCPFLESGGQFNAVALGSPPSILGRLRWPAAWLTVLEPCPLLFMADEWMHGPLLWGQIAAALGFRDDVFSVTTLQSPLPGLPGEQLLMTPRSLPWRYAWLPVDLRAVGGRICMLMCVRDSSCQAIAQLAITAQELQLRVDGLLGRCHWGWLTLSSQPLFLQGVDALQFASGPGPESLQAPLGASLDPPLSLLSAMQVSLPSGQAGADIFQGYSNNQAILITPDGLVYVEVPVFADAEAIRRNNGGIPADWLDQCADGRFGLLHRESIVLPDQILLRPLNSKSEGDHLHLVLMSMVLFPATPCEDLSFVPEGGAGTSASRTSMKACLWRFYCSSRSGPPLLSKFTAPLGLRARSCKGRRLPVTAILLPPRWPMLIFKGRGNARVILAMPCFGPASVIHPVHLVAAASGREHITVIVDAGVDLCCVDLPTAYTSRDVIAAVARFLQHDAFQILWGRGLRLRHGDVVTVKSARPTLHFDISSLLLPLPRRSTAAWLEPVRHVSVVQAAEGVHTFSVPASTTVTADVLRVLMSKTCTGKFSFFDLPFPDVLPAGRFVSFDEFLLQLVSRTGYPTRWLCELVSAIIQVVLGALPMIPGDNVWEPDPFIVEGEGVGIDHAAVLRVNDLARDLAYHAARLWQGLAEPDAEPVGDSGPVPHASATPARPVDLLDLDPSRGDRATPPAAAWMILCLSRQAGAFLRHLHLVCCVLLFPGWVSASFISPPGSSSDEEGSSPATVTTFNAATHGVGRAPHVRPAGPPPPTPANAPPVASRVLYLQATTPVEDYSLGQWPPVGPARATVSASAVTTVQVQLSQFQHGVRAVVDAIPPGTPICIHNPFTARAQCSWLEYHAGVEISPFTVFQDHANHRGWRGLALLHPQPDALAVHLIGQPLHPDNAADRSSSLLGALGWAASPMRYLGAYPAYTASRDTRHHVIWAQFLNDEPAWPTDFFPVWPGPAFNELSIVPIGADPAVVTLMLQWRGIPRAIVTPRVMTVEWLTALVARHVGRAVGDIAVPHGLAVSEFFDVPPAALKFRNGDVVYAQEAQDATDEALQAVEPWHLQDGLAAQHAPWALGFRLMFDVQVQLLRPDRPPVLARVAAEEAWCPESHCFSGDFHQRFPGMWTPVQWTSARQVQLVQVCNVAAQVHVIVATPGERLCLLWAALTQRPDRVGWSLLAMLVLGQCASRGGILLGCTAMQLQASPVASCPELAGPGVPLASASPRLMQVQVADPFAAWTVVRVEESDFFPSLLEVCPGSLASWHRGFAIADSTSAGLHIAVPHPGLAAESRQLGSFLALRTGVRPPTARPEKITRVREGDWWIKTVVSGGGLVSGPEGGGTRAAGVDHHLRLFTFPHELIGPMAPQSEHYVRSLDGARLRLPISGDPGVRPLTEVALAPVAPFGLATVIIHTLDGTSAFLLPVDTTPAAIQAAAAVRSPQVRSLHLILPPALRAVHEHQVIRLRNGDLFGLQPCPGQPGYAQRPTLTFPSLELARQVASWSLPFRFDCGDTATFWSTSSRVGRSVTIRGGGIWDPRGPTFRSPNGHQMLGSWVPVLQGGLTRLHFVSRTLPVEALVLCLIPPTDEPIGVFLAGICACRPPFGWRLVPSIRRSRAGGSLRDADVLEVDPDATFTWDPFDGRPPLLADDTPGQDDRPVEQDSSWDLDFPAAISAAFCVLSKRSLSWALLLFGWLSSSGAWGMYQPVDTASDPIRAGFFPWRAPPGHENMQDLTERAALEVVYVSPFTGPQVLGQDHFALCIPRVAPLEWIAQALRYGHSLHALSLRAPATVRDPASDIYWRSGDLLVALPPYSPPCFATATQLRHCAIWSVDFSVSSTIEVVLWRPSVRPLRSRIPAMARWNALDLTFEGVFAQRFPGRWAPVPWAADDLPHLVQCSQSADDVSVVVESSLGCFCSEIPACVDAWQLWTALPTLPSQPQVLGVPKAELRHGTLLRNGDVVSGTSPREQFPVGVALLLSLLWRWPCLGGASLLFMLTPEALAVRFPQP
ncbi:unnamed protein product [Symbiodinium sp. CCMP2592]|nr:unnamed protein product [Symbiodinium sp. CCMP2592]